MPNTYQQHSFQALLGETHTHLQTISFPNSKCKMFSSVMWSLTKGEIKQRSIYLTCLFYTRYSCCNKPRKNAKMQQWLWQTNPTPNSEISLPQTMPTFFERAAGNKTPNISNKNHHCIYSKSN